MAPLRVLVVDDNHLIRRLLALILEAAGHVSVEAESAEVALELAAELPPDLCIVDEVMPGMKGSELIRALRASPDWRLGAVPVIGISGRAGAARDLLAAGANVFVPKPIEERTIVSAIAAAMGSGHRPGQPPDLPAA
jgi:CheY-like chemotaxis protein